MNRNINEKLDELFNLLDQNSDIKQIMDIKKKITSKEIQLINDYRSNPTVEKKKGLYQNQIINDYLLCESRINYLILEINQKFKRSKICQK